MTPHQPFAQPTFPMQSPNTDMTHRDAAADEAKLARLEQQEPLRRLLKDVTAVKRERGVTQEQMAAEMDMSHRTLAEWLQGRRYPKGPGQSVLKRWLSTYAPTPTP